MGTAIVKSLDDLSPLIQKILRKAEDSYPDSAHRIWDVWEAAVGADVARRSQPLSLRRGQLTVAVSSSSWMQQLSFLRDSIRDAVNRALGEEAVQDVRLRMSTAEAPHPRHRKAEKPGWLAEELDAQTLAAIDHEVATIEDSSVREAVARALTKAQKVKRFRESRGAAPPPGSTGRRGRGETGAP
jgi:predicted nucleic acid-binding Zn ribbon protein